MKPGYLFKVGRIKIRMRWTTSLLFLLLAATSYGQDTLFYDTLIRSQTGDFLEVKYTSKVTGSEEKVLLRNGTWDFYGVDGELLKRATYKANPGQLVYGLEGEFYYFAPNGDTVLERRYKNNEIVKSIPKMSVVIIEGSVMLNIVQQYGDLTTFEYLNRHKQTRIQTQYTNLRAPDELRYYLPTEERLKSEHLLDTAVFWPNHPRNQIRNPMFENHPKLSASTASIRDGMEHWKPASPTPDFFLSEDCKSGTGCLGFRVYSLVKDIEYLQNKLVKPLKKDSFYCFSLYVKLANQCAYTSNGLGIHFSKKPIKDLNEVIEEKPNLLLNENYLPYKTKWMALQCMYKAKGGERYATIGSFKKLNEIALTPVNGHAAEAYYIIDDVSLIPVQDSTQCACNLEVKKVDTKLVFYDTLTTDTGWIQNPTLGYTFVLDNVYFPNDSYDLLPESISSLNRLLKLLQEHPSMRIEISGHTSDIGGKEHNIKLSKNRAKTVRNFLILNDIDVTRLRIKGYGPDQPIADNKTEEGQALNRRVEVKILEL